MRRISIFGFMVLFLAVGLVTSYPTTTLAQSDEALARIDQAAAHLSSYLGKTVNRNTNIWQWAEKVFPDASLDCPYPNQSYEQVETRGYRVRFTVDGVEYDYRLTASGNVLVLCDSGGAFVGTAIYRNDQPSIPTSIPPTPTIAVPTIPPTNVPIDDLTTDNNTSIQLPAADWYAWVYLRTTELMHLINPSGTVAVLKRPELANEALPVNHRIAISPNGRYLVEAVGLNTGIEALGIYDFALGDFIATLQAQAGESIQLGFGKDQGFGVAGSTFIFNPDSTQVAVGFSNTNANSWRIVIFDLATGSIINQMQATDLAALVSNPDQLLQQVLQGQGTFFPRPVYFDSNGGVHVQLILANAGGASKYPTFVWYPANNTGAISPYSQTDIDILPQIGIGLFTFQDPGTGFLPPNGPFESHNAVAQGTPSGSTFTQQTLYTDSNFFHFSPQWADDGQSIIFLRDDGVSDRRWTFYDLSSNNPPEVLPATYTKAHGISGGLLAMTDADASSTSSLYFVESLNNSQLIWQAPPQNGEAIIIWAQPPNTSFTLTSVDTTTWGNPIPGGNNAVNDPNVTIRSVCPNAVPSQVDVGTNARVTFTDGRPLNVRNAPSGTRTTQLAEGVPFTIIGGPECNSVYTWWQIRMTDGTTGWVAEGDPDGYYIEPNP